MRLRKVLVGLLVIVLIVVLIGFGSYIRPVPAVMAQNLPPAPVSTTIPLNWPTEGQGAVGILGQGVLATSGTMAPHPIASVAKVMTAYAVLQKKPLNPGEQGPSITVTEADMQLFNDYLNLGGSVTRVELGEKLTEYQLLQAILLPSSNNAADMLAVWAYGSLEAYHEAANKIAKSLNMKQSVFAGDASGFLADTVSTPEDLVKLGQAFLQKPVLKEIANQATADLPVAGTVENVNWLLGSYGIVGIKTGNTDAAGGAYLAAATHKLPDGKPVTIVAAITAAPTLSSAMTSGMKLLNSVYAGYGPVTVVRKGEVLARYKSSWENTSVTAVAAKDLSVYVWRGSAPRVEVNAKPIKVPAIAGGTVGTVHANGQNVNLLLSKSLAAPTVSWRLFRD